jgi:uncharacterized protein
MPSVAQKGNIFLAASDGDLALVTHFLDSGVPVNGLDVNGYSAIHAAASYNHIELLSYLVSRGGDVNLRDHDGDTPIYVAETREMVAALISHGADFGVVNNDGLGVLEFLKQEDEFPDVIAAVQEYLDSIHNGGNIPTGTTGMGHDRGGITASYVTASEEEVSGLSEDVRAQIGAILEKSETEEGDRDQELR